MNSLKSLFVSSLLVFTSIVWSDETITIQNGVNGYKGCEDSYTFNNEPSTNFGNADSLFVRYGGC